MKLGQDFYKDISSDVEKRFDISDHPTMHPSGIKTGVNGKVLSKFKDEAGVKQIVEFVDLRAKLCLFKILDRMKTNKCKGISKNGIKMQ